MTDFHNCAEEKTIIENEANSKPGADDCQYQADELTSRIPLVYLGAPLEDLDMSDYFYNDMPSLREDALGDGADEVWFAAYPPIRIRCWICLGGWGMTNGFLQGGP